MYRNQPLSGSGCRHQADHRCSRYQLPYQILILLCSALVFTARAEQEYFTWVDEQGRIHNTAKPPSENAEKPLPEVQSQEDDFLTEEELQEKLTKEKADNPPFFTWIDAQGRLQSQEIPQVDIEVEELTQLQAADHSLLPPLRVATEIRDAGCCAQYSHLFKEMISEYDSVVFSQPQMSVPFKTRSGGKPAWYFRLTGDNGVARRTLKLYLRGTDKPEEGAAPAALIALNKQLQPLYFIPQLITQRYLSTWRSEAYRESLISILDAEVSAFIIYFPESVPSSASLQVEWVHGKTSD